MPYNTVNPQTLYQARPEFQTELKRVRDHLHHQLGPYVNHTVRVQTMDHHVYEGRIVHIDADHLYLRVPQPHHTPPPRHPHSLSFLCLQRRHSAAGAVQSAGGDTAELTLDPFSHKTKNLQFREQPTIGILRSWRFLRIYFTFWTGI